MAVDSYRTRAERQKRMFVSRNDQKWAVKPEVFGCVVVAKREWSCAIFVE
jgi:hypothetical protein